MVIENERENKIKKLRENIKEESKKMMNARSTGEVFFREHISAHKRSPTLKTGKRRIKAQEPSKIVHNKKKKKSKFPFVKQTCVGHPPKFALMEFYLPLH